MKITDISELRQAGNGWVLGIFMDTLKGEFYSPGLIRIEFIHKVDHSIYDKVRLDGRRDNEVRYSRYVYFSDANLADHELGLYEEATIDDTISPDHLVPYAFLCESISDLIEELPVHLVYENAQTIRCAQRIWDERVAPLLGKEQTA